MKRIFDYLRKLKAWVEGYAEKPYAEWALFLIAFAESSFFPIPPDVLLIAMAVITPKKAFRYAIICSAGSVLGGVFGYFIGWAFFETIGQPILQFYGAMGHYDTVKELYSEHAFWAILSAAFTPIPYKVFTIAAGTFEVSLFTLIGGLVSQRLVRLVIKDNRVVGEEHLLTDRGSRIRDVRQGPDGALYVVTDESSGELLKIAPKR